MRDDTHQSRNVYKVVSNHRGDGVGRRQVGSERMLWCVVTPLGLMGLMCGRGWERQESLSKETSRTAQRCEVGFYQSGIARAQDERKGLKEIRLGRWARIPFWSLNELILELLELIKGSNEGAVTWLDFHCGYSCRTRKSLQGSKKDMMVA